MTTTYNHVVLLVEVVVVVTQVANRYHSFTVGLVNLGIDTVRLDAADMCIVGITNLVGHKLYHLVLDRVALSIHGYLLHVAAVLAELLVLILVGRTGTILILGKQTVNHHVGITTDGRSEVRVVVECKSIVTDIVYAILGFHHGTQSNSLNGILLACTFGLRHQGVKRLGDSTLGTGSFYLIAELSHKLAQILQLLWIWLVVNTVGQRLCFNTLLHATDTFGHRFIGQQHEFLNQLVGIFRHLEVGADRFASLVDIKVQLLAVELYTTVLESGFAQFFGQRIKLQQEFGVFAFSLFNNLLNLFVGIATVALNHGVCQMPILDVCLVVHLEDNAVAQFFLVGAQRTDKVTQTLGQHRDGTIHQIDTGGTCICFLVDG